GVARAATSDRDGAVGEQVGDQLVELRPRSRLPRLYDPPRLARIGIGPRKLRDVADVDGILKLVEVLTGSTHRAHELDGHESSSAHDADRHAPIDVLGSGLYGLTLGSALLDRDEIDDRLVGARIGVLLPDADDVAAALDQEAGGAEIGGDPRERARRDEEVDV